MTRQNRGTWNFIGQSDEDGHVVASNVYRMSRVSWLKKVSTIVLTVTIRTLQRKACTRLKLREGKLVDPKNH